MEPDKIISMIRLKRSFTFQAHYARDVLEHFYINRNQIMKKLKGRY